MLTCCKIPPLLSPPLPCNVRQTGGSSSSEQETSRSGEGDADEDQECSLVEQEEPAGEEADVGHPLARHPHIGPDHRHRPHSEELQQRE